MNETTATKPDLEDPSALARVIAEYAADKKAIDIAELDLRGVLGYTDYFVVCSGNTDRQTKAIHDGIHQGLKKDHGLLPRRVEGLGEDAIRRSLGGLAGADRVRFFDMPRIDISSTDIRRRVRDGLPIRYLVPDEVARSIGAAGWYR